MLTESMRLAGWRECPSDEVRRAWKRGDAWMVKTPSGPILAPFAELMWRKEALKEWPWRPVNPQTWDVDWRGWGDEAMPQGDREVWWRRDCEMPVVTAYGKWWDHDGDIHDIHPDGQWIAPCVKPEGL